MDADKFAKLALAHFHNKTYYSELTDDSLMDIFKSYFEKTYMEKVSRVSLLAEMDRQSGNQWSSKKYDDEISQIQTDMAELVKELLRTERETTESYIDDLE